MFGIAADLVTWFSRAWNIGRISRTGKAGRVIVLVRYVDRQIDGGGTRLRRARISGY